MLCGCLDPNSLPPLLTTSFYRHSNTDTVVTSTAIYHCIFQYTTALGREQVGFTLSADEIHLLSSSCACCVCTRGNDLARPAMEVLEGWNGQLKGWGKVMSMFPPIFPATSLLLLDIYDFTVNLSYSWCGACAPAVIAVGLCWTARESSCFSFVIRWQCTLIINLFQEQSLVLHITGGLRDFQCFFLLGCSYDIYFLMLGNTSFFFLLLLNWVLN